MDNYVKFMLFLFAFGLCSLNCHRTLPSLPSVAVVSVIDWFCGFVLFFFISSSSPTSLSFFLDIIIGYEIFIYLNSNAGLDCASYSRAVEN